MNNLVKSFLSFVLVLLALIATAKVLAIGEIYDFSSPELLERYEELTKELRCPKCQNQNLSDSVSEISDDLRREIHLMLEQGQTDQQIKDFLVARYGTFVLYNPPAAGSTLWVWLIPVFFALAGSFLVWRVLLQAKQRPIIAEGDEEDLL
jgi:cytochrome c-type biogenesis protein CcmH